jgi:hypothetical protein
MGTPTEQVGFLASEEYASRMSSPRPHSDGPQSKILPSASRTRGFSTPLGNFPDDTFTRAVLESMLTCPGY